MVLFYENPTFKEVDEMLAILSKTSRSLKKTDDNDFRWLHGRLVLLVGEIKKLQEFRKKKGLE